MGGLSWDEFLFKNHMVVALNPWGVTSLDLLDVLTREGGYGIINRGSLLARRGAMTQLALRRSDGNPESLAAQAQALTNLDEARMGRGRNNESQELANVLTTLSSSSTTLASLVSVAQLDRTQSHKLFVEASKIKSESIKQAFLTEQVLGGRWKPDPRNPLMPRKWDRVLWVVTEILYAEKLVIAKKRKAILEANMNASQLVACAALPPVNVHGGFEMSQAEDGTTVFKVSESGVPFPIGFKVIRLLYDEDGDLLAPGGIKLDISRNHRPKMRSESNEWLDPNKHPDYHMKDLFKQEPGGSLEALPVIAAEEAVEAEEQVV